ncbi:MAG: outer membrane beta-barrel protein [Flavobacteriales bacterium]|nr:outer membrane beta-barrel protein [Flavobacteriales bacterium]
MKRFLPIVIALFIISFTEEANAQGKLGVFVGVGTMFYSGDLQEHLWPHPATMRWTVDAGLHWQITRRWGLQLNYTLGEITASDQFAAAAWRKNRDLRFRSLVHEIGLRGTFDILPNDKWKFLPYITAGVSALNFEPKRDGVALRPLQTEGVAYSNWTVSIPTGLGLKYQINCRWGLKGEVLYHWTITDYLDDVSGNYIAPTGDANRDFYSDPGSVSTPGKMRGNPKFKDGFFDVNVGVVFYFVGCGSNRKGGLIEDCEKMYKDVDMEKLKDMYGQ